MTLLINSKTHQRIARPLRLHPFPGVLYIEPHPTPAALAALRLAGLVPCGYQTHSGRTLSRICGRAPRLPAIRLERCRGGRRAFGTGGRAIGLDRQRGNGIPLKMYTAVDALPLRWVPCRPKPKQRARRRVAAFCLGAGIAGRILFFGDDGGAKLGRL